MASGRRSGKNRVDVPQVPYQRHEGVEKANIGVPNMIEFTDASTAEIYNLLALAGIMSVNNSDGFSSDFVREFYNNLENPATTGLNGGVRSLIQCEIVEISHEDLREEFGLEEKDLYLDIVENYRKESDWSESNLVLHEVQTKKLITTTSSLTPEAYLIQDVLRHSVMLKTGDTKTINAQLTLVTYHIIVGVGFDVADLLLSIIRHTYRMKDPERKRLNILPLGNIIQRVILRKYDWILKDLFVDDCFPTNYHPVLRRGKARASEASTSSAIPPLQRSSSLREEVRQIREIAEDNRKQLGGIKKMLKWLIGSSRKKPTAAEEQEWEEPARDPPRHSIRRIRRPRGQGSSEEHQEDSGNSGQE